MELTINRMRQLLFASNSEYCRWNKKLSKSSNDPFLALIFNFLDTPEDTQEAFSKILNSESSHDNFCAGKLRSDGYYPVKDINKWIYTDLVENRAFPDNSKTIQELQIGYEYLVQHFESELSDNSCVFSELLSIDNCFSSQRLYTHLMELLSQKEFLLVLSWMTVIAIFPQITSVTEKKPDYTQMLIDKLFPNSNLITEAPSLHVSYENYLREKLSIDDEIEELIIVHNHGIRALMNQTRNTLLKSLIDRATHVSILITEYEISEAFTEHIRNQDSLYLSNYMPPVLMWRDFCNKYPNKITLRLSPIPAIHQYTELRFKNSANTSCFIGFYTYGGTAFDQSPFMIIPKDSAYYSVFRNEFEYAWNISHPYSDYKKTNDNVISSIEYVDNGIDGGAQGVDFAFYAGAEWLMIDSKLEIISKITERKIPFRVLINDEDSVQSIITHMRSANKAYVRISQCIKQWKTFQRKYPDHVKVRVSHIPLLHAYYHIQNERISSVRLAYYSYDNAIMQKNYSHIFEFDSRYYNLYVDEFEYLWKHGKEIDEYDNQ